MKKKRIKANMFDPWDRVDIIMQIRAIGVIAQIDAARWYKKNIKEIREKFDELRRCRTHT